jgi:MSHA pilin protein MshD
MRINHHTFLFSNCFPFYKTIKMPKASKGFTLIEIIIGIVVMSVSFSIITSLLLPATEHSAGQVQQIKAAELGQSMMNEILAKAFDENSDFVGGKERCGEGVDCSLVMGRETGETRATFNDVDDYDDLPIIGENLVSNSLGVSLADIYFNFKVEVSVCNDSDYDGTCNIATNTTNNYTAKLITITVTTPQKDTIVFATYKANY